MKLFLQAKSAAARMTAKEMATATGVAAEDMPAATRMATEEVSATTARVGDSGFRRTQKTL